MRLSELQDVCKSRATPAASFELKTPICSLAIMIGNEVVLLHEGLGGASSNVG